MGSLNRRDFLKDSALFAAALAGVGTAGGSPREEEEAARAKKKGDDLLRVACVGVRGQGRSHVGGYAGKHNCVVTVICDVDEGVIGKAMGIAEKGQGKAPRYEKDIRKVVEDKDIDIISIATPNHWHALAAIWALQNGKDVYVEKPVSHNVSEGRRIVEAARKHNRICQTGTQSRSNKGMRDAIEFVRSGGIGKVTMARGLCYKRRKSIGKVDGPQKPPATMDYNLWCGPAPNNPPRRKNVHYDWHWIWDYGNGDLGNQGIHEMDKARWGLGKAGLPGSVISVGGRFGYEDDGQTPNTQVCVFDYGDAQLVFEVRGLPTGSPYPQDDPAGSKRKNYVGNVFYGSEGVVVCPNYNSGIVLDTKFKQVIKRFSGGGDHFGNFIKAVRSRKAEDLNADIEEGHLSSALCHLANVSYRVGTQQRYDKARKAFGDNKEAVATLERTAEHLKENMVPVDTLKYQVGRSLKIDSANEKFVGDTEADALLTREYRKGFEVPAKI